MLAPPHVEPTSAPSNDDGDAIHAWLDSDEPARLGFAQCWQEKGDVLYGPAETQHAVWNSGETVAISHIYTPSARGLRVEDYEYEAE